MRLGNTLSPCRKLPCADSSPNSDWPLGVWASCLGFVFHTRSVSIFGTRPRGTGLAATEFWQRLRPVEVRNRRFGGLRPVKPTHLGGFAHFTGRSSEKHRFYWAKPPKAPVLPGEAPPKKAAGLFVADCTERQKKATEENKKESGGPWALFGSTARCGSCTSFLRARRCVRGALRRYVGCTFVRADETTHEARMRRARDHATTTSRTTRKHSGALWLSGCHIDLDSSRELDCFERKRHALRSELDWAVALRRQDDDDVTTRGGPYSSPVPTEQEERELSLWASPQSESSVLAQAPLARRHLDGSCFYCGEQGHFSRVCPNGWRDDSSPAVPVRPSKPRHNPAAFQARLRRGVYWHARGFWRFLPPATSHNTAARRREVKVHVEGGASGWRVRGLESVTFASQGEAAEVAGALACELACAACSGHRRPYYWQDRAE